MTMANPFARPHKVKTPTSFNHFLNATKIGQGAFASVYRAIDPYHSNRVVALKKINLTAISDDVTLKTTLSEIELFKRLRHHNIVQCYGSIREKLHGQRYGEGSRQYLTLVLEFVDGGDLERWIACKTSPMRQLIPEQEIWYLFYQIASAVDYIHKTRIIHRDLKPANVLLTRDMQVKLTDFGLSRMTPHNTGPKTVCGTPYYMSPERINEIGYSYSSDVWSLGCILYEMATLKSPFYGEKENITSLMAKIERADYPPITDECYSDQLRALVDACMMPLAVDRLKAWEVKRVAAAMLNNFQSNWR